MNQKLRTARSGIVFLFAVLCIVCLSLSLIISAQFAAYAESEEIKILDYKMNDGENDLWLVHYDGQQNDGESLWNGLDANKKPIAYLDTIEIEGDDGGITSMIGVKQGTAADTNYFTPYRDRIISLEINPKYLVDGKEIGTLYDISYEGNSEKGTSKCSRAMTTTATLKSKEDNSVVVGKLVKNWKIATLCNTVEVEGTYIADHAFAENRNYKLLQPAVGSEIIYHITSAVDSEGLSIAVIYDNNNSATYYTVGGNAADGYEIGSPWDDDTVNKSANEGNLVNYLIRRLPALVDDTGAYTLTVTALEATEESIYYAASSVLYKFNVAPQELGDENDDTFKTYFDYKIENRTIEYTEEENWVPNINLKLRDDDIELTYGVDYYVYPESNGVGSVDLRIDGARNLHGTYIIKNALTITPAKNEWKILPGIITWAYGTYDPQKHLIVGDAKFRSNFGDIKFRIVKVDEIDGEIKEKDIEGLTDIHYFVDDVTGESTGLVTDDVIAILKNLNAGKYRLYASVYGVEIGQKVENVADQRNYQPLPERSVDFEIFVGTNSWKAGSEPTILGWVTGKLDTTDGLINAASIFDDNPILMIYKLGENGNKDTLIYSNLPSHANTEVGDINVLKGLKSGRYYLSAEVKETANYSGLKTTVLFDVSPNNLPIWAVILIVAGSLGIVAVVFLILHQKGVLQMLTGKVIISMRTRANVDATLAAIRAAKVAREAEASIAAAKAREAEETKQSEKSDK